MMTERSVVGRFGSHPAAVWAIKHLVGPLDRFIVRTSKGRIPPPSGLVVPTLLLTTVGRRSGQERTVPLVYIQDHERYIVANARPAGERSNPWVLNLRAAGSGRVEARGETLPVFARELGGSELDRWWVDLVSMWPAFQEHYAATGQRAVFMLESVRGAPAFEGDRDESL